MLNMLLTAGAAGGQGGIMETLGLFWPFILIIGVFYFLMIRPQKKREKAVQEMRSRLEIGDEIITVGGIIGLVVNVKDDYLVVETGSDRSKIRVAKWAVQANNTAQEKMDAEKAAKAKEKDKDKDKE